MIADDEEIQARCPECGSRYIRTNETMLTSVDVASWDLDDQGHGVMMDSGDYDDFAESCESVRGAGYECRDCLSTFEHVHVRGGKFSRKKIRRLNRRAKRVAAKERHHYALIVSLGRALKCINALKSGMSEAELESSLPAGVNIAELEVEHYTKRLLLQRELADIEAEYATDPLAERLAKKRLARRPGSSGDVAIESSP